MICGKQKSDSTFVSGIVREIVDDRELIVELLSGIKCHAYLDEAEGFVFDNIYGMVTTKDSDSKSYTFTIKQGANLKKVEVSAKTYKEALEKIKSQAKKLRFKGDRVESKFDRNKLATRDDNMSIYKDLSDAIKTIDKTPREIESAINNISYKLKTNSIPKIINELNKQGYKAEKEGGNYKNNAIKVEGQTFEYAGGDKGWRWSSGVGRKSFGSNYRNGRGSGALKVDISKLPSDEEYINKTKQRQKNYYNNDPLERTGWREGNSGVSDLHDKQWSIKYHTEHLESAKKKYEKALAEYKHDLEYHTKELAKAIGEKDQYMIEFRKKFGEALRK